MMKHLMIIIFILSTLLNAANMSHEKVTANYLYNFAAYTTWPGGIKEDSFEIYLLSSNKKLTSEFQSLIKDEKLHGKKIHIRRGIKISAIPPVHMIYIDRAFLKEYKKVYSQVEGSPVLLISQSYENKRLVMINLTKTKEKSLHFEINKANILNQGLELNPKIILLGGTELDVAKLYKGAKDSLLHKEKELQLQLKKSQALNKEIQKAKLTNTRLQTEISDKNTELKATQTKISALYADMFSISEQLKQQKKVLAQEKASTQKIRDDYAKANEQLDKMSDRLSMQKQKLTSQEKKVQEKEYKLSSLTQKVTQKAIEFEELQKDLASQNVHIEDQGKIIDTQENLLLLFGGAALIFLLLLFIIYKTLKREHKTNDALKSTQIALEKQVEKTEKANASKTKFLAHMSHELRTPLNAVLGYSQLLQKDSSLSSKNQEILSTINRSGEHLLSLINDVLEVSKIESGNVSLDPISFDLYIFLQDIYNIFGPRVKNEGLKFEIIQDEGLPQFIYADINKIRQIFINILGNSVKFTAKGGITIRVGHNLKASELLVEFEDTGEGISDKEIDKLFKPFKQTISGKLGGGGAGLGLSIVLEYIELMGGKIQVKSKPAFGTVFSLSIPFEKTDDHGAEQSTFKAVKSLKPENMGTKVLIADDNKTNNDLMKETLERVGFDVRAVENGLEALRVFKKYNHAIVLLDIEMPVMNGHQAVKEIKRLQYGIATPVIAVTASVFGIDRDKALQSGFNTMIRKPFKDYEVYDAIAKALHIDYLYEDEVTQENEPDISLQKIQDPMKQDLIEAAERMNISKINALLVELERSLPNEAQGIRRFSEKFDYEGLISLLQQEG